MRDVGGVIVRRTLVFLIAVGGCAFAFLYPLFGSHSTSANSAHANDAPIVGALFGFLLVIFLASQVKLHNLNLPMVSVLAAGAALTSLLRIIDLPAGGNAMFFFVLLCGAAYGWQFGAALGAAGMATSALITAGVGPWLPYQMMAAAFIGAMFGLVGNITRCLPPRIEVWLLGGCGAIAAIAFGLIMTFWFWPYVQDGSLLSFDSSLETSASIARFWRFYVSTSLVWDLGGAVANFVAIVLVGRPVLRALRRYEDRLHPVVEYLPVDVRQN